MDNAGQKDRQAIGVRKARKVCLDQKEIQDRYFIDFVTFKRGAFSQVLNGAPPGPTGGTILHCKPII